MATFNDRGFKIKKLSINDTGNRGPRNVYTAPTDEKFAFAVVCVKSVRTTTATTTLVAQQVQIKISSGHVLCKANGLSNTGFVANVDANVLYQVGTSAAEYALNGPERLSDVHGTFPSGISSSATAAYACCFKMYSGEVFEVYNTAAAVTMTHNIEVFEYYL